MLSACFQFREILNGKQSSLHRHSQDFVCGALFIREKVDIFLVVALKTHAEKTSPTVHISPIS